MRLSTVFELLLIFLFLAFAASRTIHEKKKTKLRGKQGVGVQQETAPSNHNRYCQCSHLMCNCCRDFTLPVVSIKGPGCATVAYLNEDSMRLTMTFGEKVLRNITLAGKRPNPVCMPLPGGVSKFCGRIYGITRDGDHFKACLALELRSLEDLEAALRVSCFRFGPEGVKLEPGKPVPVVPTDEDDDDDDDYGLSDDDDDDDDEDDFGLGDDDDDDEEEEDNDVDAGDADYTGFSALSDEFLDGFFLGGSSGNKKPVKATTKAPQTGKATKKPVKKVQSTTTKVVTSVTTPATRETTKVIPTSTMKIIETTGLKINNENEIVTSTDMNAQDSQSNEVGNTPTVENVTPETVVKEEDYKEREPEEDEDEEEEEEEDEEAEEGTSKSGISIIKKGEEEEEKTSDNKESNNVVGEGGAKEERSGRVGEPIKPSGRGENISPEETERLFPGLTALIRPPSYTSYSFPPVRSARTHRRMRLPPIQS